MKKGSVYTCNGCYAFEGSMRCSPPGSAAGYWFTDPRCGIGNSIEKHGNGIDYKPVNDVCAKPKTIHSLVIEEKLWFKSCHLD